MLRVHTIPFSTNAVRVAIALAMKGVEAEWVVHSPADRSALVELSGQDLVPVLEEDSLVVYDSPVVLRHIEERHPDPPLWPADPARRAEVDVFVDWFNRVWKGPPNEIDALLGSADPDHGRISELERWMQQAQDVFESLLTERDYLMGSEPSAADVIAFPFLRYGLGRTEGDDEQFHQIVERNTPLDGRPRLEAWLQRMGDLPGTDPNPG